jgi:hypothetical protein
MLLGICGDFAIAGMIRRFHRNDAVGDFRIVITEVFCKFCLGVGRANNQDFARIAESLPAPRTEGPARHDRFRSSWPYDGGVDDAKPPSQ